MFNGHEKLFDRGVDAKLLLQIATASFVEILFNNYFIKGAIRVHRFLLWLTLDHDCKLIVFPLRFRVLKRQHPTNILLLERVVVLLDYGELFLLERIANFFADSRNFNGVLLAAGLRWFSQQSRILFQYDLTRSLLLFGFLLHVW